MCEECLKAKTELFPDATVAEFDEILWSFTCHPAGGYPKIREQLEEYAKDPQGVIDRQDQEYEEMSKMMREEEEADGSREAV